MTSENDIVISSKNLTKVYKLYKNPKDRLKEAFSLSGKIYHKDFFALKDINLEIKRGEVIGIVGKNGSGKSTLLKILSRVLTPSSGEYMVKGKVSSLLELGSGFNPELTGLENVYFYGTILGLTEEKIKGKLQEILDFADIGDFIYQPLKTYSSGMKSRLAFSVAVNVDPDILILDEVLAVGDELFRRKCYAKMEGFFKGQKTIIFVSHSVPDINQLCSRAVMLSGGELMLEGHTKMVTMYYQKMLFANKPEVRNVIKEIDELQKDEQKKLAFLLEPEKHKVEEKVSSNPAVTIPKETSSNVVEYEKQILKSKLKPYNVKGFLPSSTMIIQNVDVEINDFKILTINGELVNHLVTGQNYIYQYKVTFNQALSNINFGMGIKSEKGVPISWIIYPTSNNLYLDQTFDRGSKILVSTQFQCLLLPGTYYLDAGIRMLKDDTIFIAVKARDCLVFKVLKDEHNLGGIVYLSQQMEIKQLQ